MKITKLIASFSFLCVALAAFAQSAKNPVSTIYIDGNPVSSTDIEQLYQAEMAARKQQAYLDAIAAEQALKEGAAYAAKFVVPVRTQEQDDLNYKRQDIFLNAFKTTAKSIQDLFYALNQQASVSNLFIEQGIGFKSGDYILDRCPAPYNTQTTICLTPLLVEIAAFPAGNLVAFPRVFIVESTKNQLLKMQQAEALMQNEMIKELQRADWSAVSEEDFNVVIGNLKRIAQESATLLTNFQNRKVDYDMADAYNRIMLGYISLANQMIKAHQQKAAAAEAEANAEPQANAEVEAKTQSSAASAA